MQCPSCEFENIPGLTTCARCQSSLDLSNVVVAPPRAARFSLSSSRRRLWNRLRFGLPRPSRLLPPWRPLVFHPIPGRMLAWSIVPGLGHIRGGHPLLGWSILSAWALALLLATATIGSGTSQLCFVGAIVVHTVALVTLFGADLFYETLFVRALFGMTVFLGLRYLGYGMIVNGAEHVLTPLPIEGMRPSRLLVNGDVVLYEGEWLARSPPQRGDVVVYTLNAAVGYQRIDGYGIDRIVGAAGDRVEIRHGTLRVNGALVPTDLQPLAGTGALPVRELDVTLQAHEYLILPTLLPLMIQGQPVIDGFVRQVSVVSDHRILGRVRYRVRPWSRFGRIS